MIPTTNIPTANKQKSEKHEHKSRRGLVQYKTNPFVSRAFIESRTRKIINKKGDMMIVNSGTGEIVAPMAGFWQAEEIDSTKFIKLYVNGVKAFSELTNAGAKVFELLYLEVQKGIGKDVIWLSFSEIDQSITPMGKATFMRGMRELIEKGFIAESITQNKYFLNPDYLWNGDRLAFVKEYWKASDKNQPRQQYIINRSQISDSKTDQEIKEKIWQKGVDEVENELANLKAIEEWERLKKGNHNSMP